MSNPNESYWNFEQVQDWCQQLAATHSEWISLSEIGTTKEGRSIWILTLGHNPESTPALWLDALTHASEWAGMMGLIHTIDQWVDWTQEERGQRWFQENTIYCVPCVSPDGLESLMRGDAFLRSTTRDAKEGVRRIGFEPCDVDNNGKVLWMRWKDPAGPYVSDDASAYGLRKRRLDDAPEDAFFVSYEGKFLEWDGVRWIQAPLKHGVDLNRNFPVRWAPFEMFGMDGGVYSLSEPEARALMDAVSERSNVVAAMTLHTYTGALLTQPYNANTDLPKSDISMLQGMAEQLVSGTGYKVFRVHPDFTYDPKQSIVGVWADCLSSTLGIPAYTLEVWDPFKWAGLQIKEPARFFMEPKEHIVAALLSKASNDGELLLWETFDHPQLGPVEIGGIDYLRTIRNPPLSHLPVECEHTFSILDKIRMSLPKIQVQVSVKALEGDVYRIVVCFENHGYLSTAGLQRALDLKLTKETHAELKCDASVSVVSGKIVQDVPALDGWGQWQSQSAKNLLYPSLPADGHRQSMEWVVSGVGEVEVHWTCSRSGSGVEKIAVGGNAEHQLRLF